jgi:pyruvate,water dikinase
VTLQGAGASGGRYEGYARVVRGPDDFENIQEGDVLVVRTTSTAYNVLLPLLGAVVTDRGGVLCHAAVVAREFGIPGVFGTGDATVRIPDGARIVVDGDRGVVEILS